MPFQEQGLIRTVYLTILLTHIVLAVVIVPLIFMTLSRALTARFDRHRADRAMDAAALAVRVGDRASSST